MSENEHDGVDVLHPDAFHDGGRRDGVNDTYYCPNTGKLSWAGKVYDVHAADVIQANRKGDVFLNGQLGKGVPDSRVPEQKKAERAERLKSVTQWLDGLTMDERTEFLSELPFCRSCGCDLRQTHNGVCHCENDE